MTRLLEPTHILIVGDFNCKEIYWTNNTTETSKTSIQSLLLDKITTLGWYQHVKSYTRFKEGQKPSLLDLIITNEENMIENLCYHNPIGKSDHVLVSFNYLCYKEQAIVQPIPRYYRGNYCEMREFLKETDWSILSEDKELDAKWSYFKNIIISATDKYVPKSKPGRVQPKWLNNEVYKLIKKNTSPGTSIEEQDRRTIGTYMSVLEKEQHISLEPQRKNMRGK